MAFALQIEVDPHEEGGRERAHALVDVLYDFSKSEFNAKVREALNLDPETDEPGQAPTPEDDLAELGGDDLREFVHGLAVGADDRVPLNPGERAMVRAIALEAPAPFPHAELLKHFVTHQKYGNVSSGLARRFAASGYKRPYADAADESGYAMSVEVAKIILDVLAETEE